MKDFCVEFFIIGECNKGERANSPKHSCYEIIYYLNGVGMSVIEDKNYEFKENTFAVVRPDTAHYEQHYTGTQVLCIGFHCPPDVTL